MTCLRLQDPWDLGDFGLPGYRNLNAVFCSFVSNKLHKSNADSSNNPNITKQKILISLS